MIPLILGIITISIKKIYCYSIAVVHPLPSLPPPSLFSSTQPSAHSHSQPQTVVRVCDHLYNILHILSE